MRIACEGVGILREMNLGATAVAASGNGVSGRAARMVERCKIGAHTGSCAKWAVFRQRSSRYQRRPGFLCPRSLLPSHRCDRSLDDIDDVDALKRTLRIF